MQADEKGRYYDKRRKIAFPDSSEPLHVGDEYDMTGEEVAAPGPFYGATQTAQERLFISRHGVGDRPVVVPRRMEATYYDPRRAPCNEHAHMKKGGPQFKPADQHPIRQYAQTEYQRKLVYAEAPNIYLADFDPETHYVQQA